MNTKIQRLTAAVLIASLVSTAHAGLINQAAPTDRERVASHVEREDVLAELAARGISREDAKARVAALTDAEAASLAGRVDELPAGGFVQALVVIPMLIIRVVGLVAYGVFKGIEHLATPNSKTPTACIVACTE